MYDYKVAQTVVSDLLTGPLGTTKKKFLHKKSKFLHSILNFSTQLRLFFMMYDFQVAQTVVSDLLTSPLGNSSPSLDPNTLLDALVEHIKEGLINKYVILINFIFI